MNLRLLPDKFALVREAFPLLRILAPVVLSIDAVKATLVLEFCSVITPPVVEAVQSLLGVKGKAIVATEPSLVLG